MFQNNYGSSEPNFFAGGGGASQYGAGGGFMPSQGAEPTQGIKKFHQQTLRAITIKQIKEATSNIPDDNIVVDGEDLNNITLIAKVVNVTENATYLDMQVEDGTGRLDVKFYVDNEEDNADFKRRQCEPGHYVRVHGHLRPMDNKYPLVAFNIRQISDHNEVTFHFLQCIYQHAHFTRGAGKTQNAQPTSAQKQSGAPQQGNDGSTSIMDAVANAYLSAGASLSIQKATESLGGRYTQNQVRDTAQALTDQGILFNISNDAYKHCALG